MCLLFCYFLFEENIEYASFTYKNVYHHLDWNFLNFCGSSIYLANDIWEWLAMIWFSLETWWDKIEDKVKGKPWGLALIALGRGKRQEHLDQAPEH